MLQRRMPKVGATMVKIALPVASKFFVDLPRLREHCSATTYGDGSPRTPGDFWFKNRETCYEVIVFDPDSASRLPCRGSDFDTAFLLAEKLLGAPDAPWEHDKYLAEQLAKKQPKGKRKS